MNFSYKKVAAKIAAECWNDTQGVSYSLRAGLAERVIKQRLEEHYGSGIIASILISLAVKYALHLLEKWIENNILKIEFDNGGQPIV